MEVIYEIALTSCTIQIMTALTILSKFHKCPLSVSHTMDFSDGNVQQFYSTPFKIKMSRILLAFKNICKCRKQLCCEIHTAHRKPNHKEARLLPNIAYFLCTSERSFEYFLNYDTNSDYLLLKIIRKNFLSEITDFIYIK